jgi:hypothetical protein
MHVFTLENHKYSLVNELEHIKMSSLILHAGEHKIVYVVGRISRN